MLEYSDIIVDLQQGDSGKGKVASYLAAKGEYTKVVRYNGSNNAGHTIHVEDKKIVTHSIPVGVLHGIRSVIGPGCVLNVDHFFRELSEIQAFGFKTQGLIKIASNAHIITSNHLQEDGKDESIGTTRRGNGPAYRDKYSRKGLRASDVGDLNPYLVDMYEELHCSNKNERILFEGAQGFYLDIDWGDYPFVTSSHCTSGGAVLNGVSPKSVRKIFGVAKAYETYVGNKKFEPDDPIFSRLRNLGAEFGATTGRPRQCNWMNIDNIVRAAVINGVTDLVINKVDILRQLGTWKVYERGQTLHLTSESDLKSILTNRLPGIVLHWSDNPRDMGSIV